MPDVSFTIVLRGYDVDEVNDLIRRANLALASPDRSARAKVERELRAPLVRVRWRGYDRGQVDQRLATLADQLSP